MDACLSEAVNESARGKVYVRLSHPLVRTIGTEGIFCMRWSIIRLIWIRELRDQLRDRRTIFMIAVLPILLYPLAGFGTLQIAGSYLTQRSIVGIAGADSLHPWHPAPNIPSSQEAASWMSV